MSGSICGDDGALKPKKKNGRDENETAWRFFYCDNLFFLVERLLAFRYLYIHTHISACFVVVLEIRVTKSFCFVEYLVKGFNHARSPVRYKETYWLGIVALWRVK